MFTTAAAEINQTISLSHKYEFLSPQNIYEVDKNSKLSSFVMHLNFCGKATT